MTPSLFPLSPTREPLYIAVYTYLYIYIRVLNLSAVLGFCVVKPKAKAKAKGVRVMNYYGHLNGLEMRPRVSSTHHQRAVPLTACVS